ncbi:MAG: M23 family metallopeptidase [Alphaproteobacteria bacterium]|nr:M23 family metallopeptidase [Alphaproteobacteria bacterium]
MLILAIVASSSLFSAAAPSDEPSVVPVDVRVVAAPQAVRGEGMSHRLYELRLNSFAPREMQLEALEIRDQAGAELARFEGEALDRLMVQPGVAADHARVLPAGGQAIVYLDAATPDGAPAPLALSHSLRFAASRPDAPASRTTITTPAEPVSGRPVVILDPPLRGPGWLAANALSNDADHRRTMVVVDGQARVAQRFAIDFVRLDDQGRAFVGDPQTNAAWVGFGAPVLAGADGVVVEATDDLPDNTPGALPATPISLQTIGGNHVVVRLADGSFVFYGHLKQGSVRVHEGQAVTTGEVLGALGNSGQSDAPHLHIHVSDGASALGADGRAFAFSRFELAGHVPSLAVLETAEGWVHAAEPRRPLTGELPIDNAVVDFAD